MPDSSAARVIADRHRKWILVGWEKHPGDGPFDFGERFGSFYDFDADDGVFYDDFDPDRRVARSAAEYGSIWTEPFTALREARHAVTDGPDVVVGSGDLASSTLEFAARLVGGDGQATAIRTRSSLVWRQSGDDWRIVREHNSTTVVDEADLSDALATAA